VSRARASLSLSLSLNHNHITANYYEIEYELVGNWYLKTNTRAVELPYSISNTWVVALIVGEKNRTKEHTKNKVH
jgi:hypothetical protein